MLGPLSKDYFGFNLQPNPRITINTLLANVRVMEIELQYYIDWGFHNIKSLYVQLLFLGLSVVITRLSDLS